MMRPDMAFHVHGTPAPQGSKRHVGNGVMIESSAKVKPWREAVKFSAIQAHVENCCDHFGPHYVGADAVAVELNFYLARPKGHYGTGRNAGVVKQSAPTWPTVKPDLDKLIRSTLDALTDAYIWGDDSQVIEIDARKIYLGDLDSKGATPGARIWIGRADRGCTT